MVLPRLEKPAQINIDKRITDIKKYGFNNLSFLSGE
jgi:hypothetical protein